jgi:hypothetical protein
MCKHCTKVSLVGRRLLIFANAREFARFVSRIAVAFALILTLCHGPADAEGGTLPLPQSAPILTMTGAVANTNAAGSATFDAAMFAALPRQRITTSTPWYDQPRTFEGPLLRDLLAATGASGRMLKVEALNDYAALVPFSDALAYNVIIADRIDGELIPIRGRGPLFIIYPFDQMPQLKTEQYYQRAVWQVKSIEVRP